MGESAAGARCVALVGPYQSGKTTLMEALLISAEAIHRKGTAKDGNTVGDSGPEARKRNMSTEPSMASCSFMGDPWSIIDCPGSIEFAQDAYNALMVADVAVIVVEPLVDKAAALAPLFQFLDAREIPHMVFINKLDHLHGRVSEVLEALQAVSQRPLVLRQVPIRDEDHVGGYVDLISERAYEYKAGQASALVQIPETMQDHEQEARQELLESLADFDDALLEQLLEDVVPEKSDIYRHLTENLAQDRIVPVVMGAGETQNGVFRLWKSLRHDTPGVATTAARRGFNGSDLVMQVFKSSFAAHAGKLSFARVWSGSVAENTQIAGHRLGGLYGVFGEKHDKIAAAGPGAIVALGRTEDLHTGDVVTTAGRGEGGTPWPTPMKPVYAVAVHAKKREDEVKMTAAMARLAEEDPSYAVEQNADTNELLLWGQGEIHLAVGLDRMLSKFNVEVSGSRPQVSYKETIQKPIEQHARHKKQSGGHGQFGDVQVAIKPLPRGSGFEFDDRIVGGAVPRQFIPSVEHGVKEFMSRGPLGFPVVDISVCLFDGQYHSVDSSDQAFRTAAAMAMREGMPKCRPVLLEPIYRIEVDVPNEHTSKITNLVTGRRGQILGFEAKAGWSGWDTLEAFMPQSEMHDMIIELRSLTQGVGTFRFAFHHMSELVGREADLVIQQRAEAHAA